MICLNVRHIHSGNQIQCTKVQKALGKGRTKQLHKEPEPETRPCETILTCEQNNVLEVDAELLGWRQNLSTDNQTSEDKNSAEVQMVFNDVKSGREESEDMMKFQKQSRWKGVDPVLFFKDEVVIKSIKSFFGIKESFPLEGHLVTRSTDNARRMYYISKSVKEIVELNEEVSEQLKIASLGIKMFVSIKYSQNLCSLPERSYFHWNYIHILLKKVYALYLFYFRKDIDQRMAVHVHIGCLMRVYHYCSHTSAHGYYMHLHQISTAYYNTEPSTLLILSTPVLVRKLRP